MEPLKLKPFMAGFVDMINFDALCLKTYHKLEGQEKEAFHQTLKSAGIPVTLKECLDALEKIKSQQVVVPPDRLCFPPLVSVHPEQPQKKSPGR